MIRVLYGVATQTLDHYPVTRVASATYRLERLDRAIGDSARVIASGAATVSTISTTTNAAAGPGEIVATKVPVAATAGITVGMRLEIQAADGPGEVFEVDGIGTGYLLATAQLVGTYASGATVKGIQITAAMSDTAAADEAYVLETAGPLRVVWGYTLGGSAVLVPEMIAVVRHTGGDMDQGDAVAMLVDGFPDLFERIGNSTRLKQWAKFCARDLDRRMRTRGNDPARYMTGDQGTHALMWRMVLHAAENGIAPPNREIEAWADEAAKHFAAVWDGLTGGEPGKETRDTTARDTAAPGSTAGVRGMINFGG